MTLSSVISINDFLTGQMIEREISPSIIDALFPLNWIVDFLVFSIMINLSWTLIWIDRPCLFASVKDRNDQLSLYERKWPEHLYLSTHMWHIKVITVYSIEQEDMSGQSFFQRMERSTFAFDVGERCAPMPEGQAMSSVWRWRREEKTLNLHWLQNSPVYIKLHRHWYLKIKFLHWPWRPQRVLL